MPLGVVFTLNDVVSEIENAYGTEPSTIQKLSLCANVTVPSDTVDGVKPTKLSDWEGFPVPPTDHWTHTLGLKNLGGLVSYWESTASSHSISYSKNYDHAGSIDKWNTALVYKIPRTKRMTKLSIFLDADKTSYDPEDIVYNNTNNTTFGSTSYDDTLGRYRTNDYPNDVQQIDQSKADPLIANNALYVWSPYLLGVSNVILMGSQSYSGILAEKKMMRRRFYPLIGGAKATGTFEVTNASMQIMGISLVGTFIRGGYYYKVTSVVTNNNWNFNGDPAFSISGYVYIDGKKIDLSSL